MIDRVVLALVMGAAVVRIVVELVIVIITRPKP